jgi:hypothetical protein
LVRVQLSGLKELPADTDSVEYKTWKQKTRALLTRIYSDKHHQVQSFDALSWWISVDHLQGQWFERGRGGATAILETALYDLEVLSQPDEVSSDTIDPELWGHVQYIVR